MNVTDSLEYAKITSAVLRAYELIPEAYRQKFKTWQKRNSQTYVEFTRDLTSHINRWKSTLEISTFDGLYLLIILEQLNMLPVQISTFITEKKETDVAKAATSADEFTLLHKSNFCERSVTAGGSEMGSAFLSLDDHNQTSKVFFF